MPAESEHQDRADTPGASGGEQDLDAAFPQEGLGLTPEELAQELGMPNAKQIRGYLREAFPRDPELLWTRWGPLEPELEHAVRRRFGNRR